MNSSLLGSIVAVKSVLIEFLQRNVYLNVYNKVTTELFFSNVLCIWHLIVRFFLTSNISDFSHATSIFLFHPIFKVTLFPAPSLVVTRPSVTLSSFRDKNDLCSAHSCWDSEEIQEKKEIHIYINHKSTSKQWLTIFGLYFFVKSVWFLGWLHSFYWLNILMKIQDKEAI